MTDHKRVNEFSPRKRLAFRLVALLLPVMVLGLCELILRLCGWGGYASIIRKVGPVEGGTLVITDQAGAVSWFFANPTRPGYNDQYAFLEPKPTNTIRIFIVGESAARGYPQPRNLAASAFLKEMLQDAWPHRTVEVINLGTTAVASFPVLEIMTEALDYQPDLVVISTGHNEFFGTYGVASIGWAGGRPWTLRATRFVHSLALVQGLERMLRPKEDGSKRTLMETMVGRSHIAPNDWQRTAAANNLRHNVAEMIDRCQSRGVPVLVCTQPSNERDLAPVGEDRIDGLPPAAQQEIQSLLATVESRMRVHQAGDIPALRRIIEMDPNHARAHFLLGQALAADGRHVEARDEFDKARDLDSMPWRTPSLSQQAIIRAASERNAPICDLVKVFRDASTNGIIGWELMDDHVHPTLRGQALTAETILDCLTNLNGDLRVSAEERARAARWDEYARRLGDNVYDRYGVAYQMSTLFNVPFMRANNPEACERFNTLVFQFENAADPEVLVALREWQTFRPHAGGKRPVTGMVARVLMRRKKFAEALELFEIARKSVPEYTSWHMEYTYFALACKDKIHGPLAGDDRDVALREIEQGRFLLQRGFSETGFTERYTGRLHQLRGEFSEAIPFLMVSRQKLTGFELVAADEALIMSFLKTGQNEKARELAAYGATHAGQYAGIYQNILNELPAAGKNPDTNTVSTNSTPD